MKYRSLLGIAASGALAFYASVANAGTLTGSKSTQPASANLSTEGSADWSHWGLNAASDWNHKSGITAQISNVTKLGTGTQSRYTDGTCANAWSGGTPTASVTSTTAGIYTAGVGNGFQITVPADTTTRVLKIYAGVWKSQGKLEASLSDGSAPAILDTTHGSTTGSANTLWTLNYSANSAGQSLTVKWTVQTSHDTAGGGTVGWQAATLAATGNAAPSVSLTSPANGAAFTAPASIVLAASANDSNGTVSNVEFFSGSTLLGSDATSPYSLTWSSVAAGNYALSAKATDNGGASSTSSTVNVTVNASSSSGGTGTLTSTKAGQPSSLNLTAQGTRDWAHWGLNAIADFNHKSGVTQQISNYTKVGTGTVSRYADATMANSWTDGTPTPSASGVISGLYVAGVGNGFQVTAPADTTVRVLKVYCGVWKSTAKLEARLSDSSAPVVADTTHNSTTGSANTSFSIRYAAASAGQTLTVKWTVQTSHDTTGGGTVGWQCATLSNEGDPIPPSVSITSPSNGAQFTPPASIGINASAADSDGTVSKVDFFSGTSLLGSDLTSPYSVTWSSVGIGNYSLTAKATDNSGAVTTSAAVNVTVSSTSAPASGHPRLFVTPARLSEIKAAINVAGSVHQEMFNVFKARVDRNTWQDYDENTADTNYNYARGWLAMDASFMYLLTGNSTYAQNAYKQISDMYSLGDPDGRYPHSGYGLARATTGMGLALTYDFAYDGLTTTQRSFLLTKLKEALNAWGTFSHANLSSPYSSNWNGVCRGAELVMMLAAREEGARSSRYTSLKSWLNQHINNGYGPSGWGNEGTGYTDYAGAFFVPAVMAARSVGDTGLNTSYNSKAFWKMAMFAYSFSIPDPSNDNHYVLMSGVDGASPKNAEGFTSAVMNGLSSTDLAAYKHFYDRYNGKQSQLTLANRYDLQYGGRIWAMLYYPENLASTDPVGVVGRTLFDTSKGMFYVRNRWQDTSDIQVSLAGDFKSEGQGWNAAEAFQLGLVAYGKVFIGGPAKSTSNHALFSCLTVDGKAYSATTHTGAVNTSTATANGAYVIVNGGTKYSNLGLSSASRHMLVDFSGKAAPGLISTMDRLTAAASHAYAWQINVGDEAGNLGITSSSGTEGGRPFFKLTASNGAFVKGWVMHPSNAGITAADPLKVTTTASNTDIWVVMVTGTGTAPTGSVSGTGLGSVLTVGTASVRFDSTANRIVAQ